MTESIERVDGDYDFHCIYIDFFFSFKASCQDNSLYDLVISIWRTTMNPRHLRLIMSKRFTRIINSHELDSTTISPFLNSIGQ